MNATSDNPERDSSELEREADKIRADMDRTLDAIERKFSPSQLLDRSMAYLRDHGGDLSRTIGEALRRNPVPIVVTVAGLAWLVTSAIGGSRARSQGVGAGAGPEEEPSSGPGHRLHERVQDRVRATRERIRASREAAANTVSQAMDATRTQTRRAQDRVYSLVDEQPLVLGALALAIGAIIGAAVPATEYEHRTVGKIRDRAVQKAKQAGERQYENLRSKLEEHEGAQGSSRAH